MKKFFALALTGCLLLAFRSDVQTGPVDNAYKPIDFENLFLSGELYTRTMKNMDRMEEEKYQPANVFAPKENDGWPGDHEGRTILALVLDAQVTKREPKYLAEILKKFPQKMNSKGYFGDMYIDSAKVSEQQLASHGWVLRALCEYYLWKKDPKTLEMIDKIINNLVLPTTGYHSKYPIDPDKREHGGSHGGTTQGTIGAWMLSTDIGCDHIFMDGTMQAYQIRPSEKLKAVIEEMVNIFLKIDQVKIKAQTHATLTALRGLLRWYEVTGRKDLLTAAASRWELYKREGMTENYENYNWFGRPEWTEPCAVVDSYMTAVYLWRFTGKKEYLEDAHHIYYNGLGLEQRANGGFGIQSCSGAKNSPNVEATLQEAHWCCTMRGGEGLSRAAQFSFFTKDKYVIAVPFYQNAIVTVYFGEQYVKLQEITDYPYTGNTLFKVIDCTVEKPVSLKMFVPSWYKNLKLSVNGKHVGSGIKDGFATVKSVLKENTLIELKGDMAIGTKDVYNKNSIKGYYSFTYGPFILGYRGKEEIKLDRNVQLESKGTGIFKVKNQDVILSPLFHMMTEEVGVDNKYKRQILFKAN